jgi:hypothetical protein
MRLSKYWTLEECTRSDKRYGDNTPTEAQVIVIKSWCENIGDPCREFVGGPLGAHSVFRSKKYNSALPGSDPNSEHMIATNDSCAGDIDTDIYGIGDNESLFWFIYNNLDFNILIWEFDNQEGKPEWIHVSRSVTHNKKLVLRKVRLTSGEVLTKYYNGKEWLNLK